MAKNLISGDTTTINESGDDISVDLNTTYTDFIGIDETLSTTAQTLPSAINELIPVVLYESDSGTTEEITLSDDASNYSYLEIFYGWSGGSLGFASTKVFSPDSKSADLTTVVLNNSNIYIGSARWLISGTSVSPTISEYWRWSSSGTATRTQSAQVNIWRIVGYK